MNAVSREVVERCNASQKTMVEQLYRYCEINSGSENLSGLSQMRALLADDFSSLADHIETRPLAPITTLNMQGDTMTQQCGDALLIRKRPECKRRVLLGGHMDTVYSIDHPFQALRALDDNTINGPGVADMKGGLLVILHALKTFEATCKNPDIGWDVLINGDEEIGSPASSALFAEIAPLTQAALVYEPAMNPTGTLARNRRGSGKLTLVATGRAAHVGRAFDEGHNAICYLARAVSAIHALNGKREGVTLNVGKIAGGQALNMVPDKAVAKLDVRISRPEDEEWIMAQLNLIREELVHDYCQLQLYGNFARPVKRVNEATTRLFHRIQAQGELMGLAIDWQDSGGCCDGNNYCALGLPVLDTLGVRGGAIHSQEEYILLDSLSERAALSALILHDLANGGLEDLHK